MALPKMSIPRYTVTLPSTGTKLNMRPYLVKEEKVLMIALESQDPEQITSAVKNIIATCYNIDGMDNLTVFDIEMLFLQLRAKSVGERMEVQIKCTDCEKMSPIAINIDEIKVSNQDLDRNILLEKENGVGVTMKYPSLELIGAIAPEKFNSIEGVMDLIVDCIEIIFDDDNVYNLNNESREEVINFIESLNTQQFKKIQAFFQDSPAVAYETKKNCTHCGESQEIKLRGLNSFFS
jgi:hypothetical protein